MSSVRKVRRLLLLLLLVAVASLFFIGAPTGAAAPVSPHAPSHAASAAAHGPVLGRSIDDGATRAPSSVPSELRSPTLFLPETAPASYSSPLVVNPRSHYNSEPAPMGIGDFGVGPNDTAYTYNTTAFEGNWSWNSLSLTGGNGASFTIQLNIVLYFVDGGNTYAYWIQDVAFPTQNSQSQLGMGFELNIWNFSNNGYCMPTNSVTGNGTMYAAGGCINVYITGATTQPGAATNENAPNSIGLLDVSSQLANGVPTVSFQYWDDVTNYQVTYDNAIFPWATAVTSDKGFLVDGSTTAGSGNFYSAELDMGGPGGGSSITLASSTRAADTLQYWNGHNFESTPNAWNFGGDTAEATSNAQVWRSDDGHGTPESRTLNGTAKNATPAMIYDRNRVGNLSITATGFPTGTIAVAADTTDYSGSRAVLTLDPGTYPVWLNTTGTSIFLGDCSIWGGKTTTVDPTSLCAGGSNAPWVGTITPTPSSVDVGQPVTFSSSVSGGSGTYSTYTWATTPASGLGCAASSSASVTCTPTNANVYSVTLSVTDSLGHTGTNKLTGFQVYPTPTVSVPLANVTSVNVGQTMHFTATAGNPGSGGDVYSWAASQSWAGCSATGLTYTCTPTASGTFNVTVTVKDSNLGTGSNTSATETAGTPAPSVSTPAAAPASADVGQSVVWSVTASGGTAPYTYSWTAAPASGFGCVMANAPSITCTPTTAGSYTVSVLLTDANSKTATATSPSYTVSADPAISAPMASRTSADVGQSFSFTSTLTSPGLGPDSYAWTASAAGLSCPTVNALTVTCSAVAAGSYTVTVAITDANAFTANAVSASFTVFALPTISSPTASPTTVQVGATVVFTAATTNAGSGTDTFSWSPSSNALGCSSSTTNTLSCTPTAAGTGYTVTATITDSNGGTGNGTSAPFTVTAVQGALTVSASVNVTTGTAPLTVLYQATVTGGSLPYSYSWNFEDGSAPSAAADPTHTFTIAGTYAAVLTVTDNSGTQKTATAPTVTATSSGQGSLVVSASAAPNPATAGQSVAFTLTASGGSGTYAFAWRFADGDVSAVQDPTHDFASAGTYVVGVWVNDTEGHSAHTTVSVTVNAASSSKGPASGISSLFGPLGSWGPLLLLAILAVVVLAIVLSRRKSKASPAPVAMDAQAPWPYEPAAAPPPSGGWAPPPGSDGPTPPPPPPPPPSADSDGLPPPPAP